MQYFACTPIPFAPPHERTPLSNDRDILAAHGLRCTKQREMIYSALRSTKSHPTAEELQQLVPGTSTATIYNTLEALCDAGLCSRISSTSGAARYDADMSDHLHVVLESGEIIDVPEELSRALLSAIKGSALHKIENALCVDVQNLRLELHGKSCKKAASLD